MPYTVVSSSTSYPAQVSYQLINLTANIVLSWPFSFVGGPIAAGFNDVMPDMAGRTITLPDATLASQGTDVIFNNISIYTFDILKNDSTLLLSVVPGQIVDFKLYDSTTAAGLWRIIPFGGGYNGITAFTAQSSDNSITIANGVVNPPGAMIDFQLPTSLFNLNNVVTTGGFPVITSASSPGPLTWGTRDLVAGDNITIDNPNGIGGDPVISLSSSLAALVSIEVGNFTITGSILDANGVNSDLSFSTNGTGKLNFNGVLVDTSNNISNVNNLSVSGFFNNPLTPKAWCIFTDTIVGPSNLIVIEEQSNITSISGAAGSYEIFFTTHMNSITYGILLSFGTAGGALPPVYRGFWTARNLGSVVISIVDDSNQAVDSVPYGATIMIMSL